MNPPYVRQYIVRYTHRTVSPEVYDWKDYDSPFDKMDEAADTARNLARDGYAVKIIIKDIPVEGQNEGSSPDQRWMSSGGVF